MRGGRSHDDGTLQSSLASIHAGENPPTGLEEASCHVLSTHAKNEKPVWRGTAGGLWELRAAASKKLKP